MNGTAKQRRSIQANAAAAPDAIRTTSGMLIPWKPTSNSGVSASGHHKLQRVTTLRRRRSTIRKLSGNRVLLDDLLDHSPQQGAAIAGALAAIGTV